MKTDVDIRRLSTPLCHLVAPQSSPSQRAMSIPQESLVQRCFLVASLTSPSWKELSISARSSTPMLVPEAPLSIPPCKATSISLGSLLHRCSWWHRSQSIAEERRRCPQVSLLQCCIWWHHTPVHQKSDVGFHMDLYSTAVTPTLYLAAPHSSPSLKSNVDFRSFSTTMLLSGGTAFQYIMRSDVDIHKNLYSSVVV